MPPHYVCCALQRPLPRYARSWERSHFSLVIFFLRMAVLHAGPFGKADRRPPPWVFRGTCMRFPTAKRRCSSPGSPHGSRDRSCRKLYTSVYTLSGPRSPHVSACPLFEQHSIFPSSARNRILTLGSNQQTLPHRLRWREGSPLDERPRSPRKA